MEKTVMITGASRGIGLATVRLFQSRNWRVAACVRNRAGNEWLGKIADLEVFELDVTKKSSIEKAVDEIKSKMGPIDVLVNNAGYGLIGAFEETPEEEIRSCFETNFFGALNVIKAVLPAMRDARKGCIIQIASVGGRLSFPLYSTYCATKWALEGFSESLAYELKEFGIKVKIVEPGPINTDFHKESMHLIKPKSESSYARFANRVIPNLIKAGESGPSPEKVAEVIYRAANDGLPKLRYPVASRGMLFSKKVLTDATFIKMMRWILSR